MKKLSSIFMSSIFITILLTFMLAGNVLANPYLPMTSETCTELLQDVRQQYYSEELSSSKGWNTRLKGLTVTFDPSTASREYFADTYNLFLAEEYTVVGCPAWPLEIEELRTLEEPSWTIPKALFESDSAPLYWVFNSDFVAICPPNAYALVGLTLHELGHVLDHKAGFTNKSAVILGEPYSRITAYPGREMMNEMFIYSTRSHKGSIIPQYEFAKWFHGGLSSLGINDIPVEHPFIDVITIVPTPSPDMFKIIVLQDIERTLLYNPGVPPQEVLGDLYPSYNYLMND